MEVKYRLLLLVYTALLVFSLFRIAQYVRGDWHLGAGLYVYLAIAAVSLLHLAQPVYLGAFLLLEKTSLLFADRSIAGNPLNPDLHMMKGVVLLRVAIYRLKQAMHMLVWTNARRHASEIQARITRELVSVTKALSAFDRSLGLDQRGLLTRGGGVFSDPRLNPRRPFLAQVALHRLNEVFPRQIYKTPPDEHGPVLLQALYLLVDVLALDPLSLEAYGIGRTLMLHLSRFDIAQEFDTIRMRLAHPPAMIAERI